MVRQDQTPGELHAYDPANYKSYETLNLSTIGLRPDGGQSKTSLFQQMETYNFFSWMDYGDVPMDFEGGTGQWGLKYDFDYHMAQQYARTLQPGWWTFFAAAGRHVADIDIHHSAAPAGSPLEQGRLLGPLAAQRAGAQESPPQLWPFHQGPLLRGSRHGHALLSNGRLEGPRGLPGTG